MTTSPSSQSCAHALMCGPLQDSSPEQFTVGNVVFTPGLAYTQGMQQGQWVSVSAIFTEQGTWRAMQLHPITLAGNDLAPAAQTPRSLDQAVDQTPAQKTANTTNPPPLVTTPNSKGFSFGRAGAAAPVRAKSTTLPTTPVGTSVKFPPPKRPVMPAGRANAPAGVAAPAPTPPAPTPALTSTPAQAGQSAARKGAFGVSSAPVGLPDAVNEQSLASQRGTLAAQSREDILKQWRLVPEDLGQDIPF